MQRLKFVPLAVALGLLCVSAAETFSPKVPVKSAGSTAAIPIPLCNPDDPTCAPGGPGRN